MIDSKVVVPHSQISKITGKEKGLKNLYSLILKLARDERGQDMVEYALLAGFIAVAAGAILPPIADNISIIFSKMASVVGNAALQ
ncbi:MAG: Flp family type IVb pilin, partial [Chloroflexi bacterium]|nr:Flp family type IVb pilin [Chloroflexota bacterium]